MSSDDWTSDLEIRDNPGKLLFPGGTRDRGSKSGTVPGVPGQLAIMGVVNVDVVLKISKGLEGLLAAL